MTDYAPLDPSTQVWTTGVNAPGYLPNPDDVRVFATQEQARADVADRIDEWADDLMEDRIESPPEGWDITDAEEFGATLGDTARAQSEAVRHNADLDYAQSFSVQVDNLTHQPPVFWAQPSTVGEYFGGETDAPEYADLVDEIHESRIRENVHNFATADLQAPTRLDQAAGGDTFQPQQTPAMPPPLGGYIMANSAMPSIPKVTGIVQ